MSEQFIITVSICYASTNDYSTKHPFGASITTCYDVRHSQFCCTILFTTPWTALIVPMSKKSTRRPSLSDYFLYTVGL